MGLSKVMNGGGVAGNVRARFAKMGRSRDPVWASDMLAEKL